MGTDCSYLESQFDVILWYLIRGAHCNLEDTWKDVSSRVILLYLVVVRLPVVDKVKEEARFEEGS